MNATNLLGVLVVLTIVGYILGRNRAVKTADGQISRLHSVPSYYGFYVGLWALLPSFVLFAIWRTIEGWVALTLAVNRLPEGFVEQSSTSLDVIETEILNVAYGVIPPAWSKPPVVEAANFYNMLLSISNWALFVIGVLLALLCVRYAIGKITMDLRARNRVEKVVNVLLILCSVVAILTTIGIVMSLLFEAIRFFAVVPISEFLFGLKWSPQIAMRADQVGSSGAFGAVPLFAGTMLITVIAMLVAVPIGLLSAIYMSEYAPKAVRASAKPMLEILAGVPTVVYGFFAALTMAPFVRDVFGGFLDWLATTWVFMTLFGQVEFDVSSESALAAGVVMGVMIIPFVSSLSDDVMNAVPQSLRDGAYGLGATKSETIWQILLPAALPGIVGAVMLAISRAVGETMIVVMAAGLNANLTANPLEAVTTVTTQIATILVGDQEFDSPKTLSAFGLGLVLFVVTLFLNFIALRVVQKYREKYD